MSAFPWDSLKAETLRSVAREIGFPNSHKRDVLIRLLETVEQDGLDLALAESKELGNVASASSSKRKADSAPLRPKRSTRSDPQRMVTRYKGVRNKSYRPTTTTTTTSRTAKPRRKTGAPRKQGSRGAARTFDGVVLPARRRGQRKKRENSVAEEDDEQVAEEDDADSDADGSMDVDQENTFHVPDRSDPLDADGNGSEKENESPLAKIDHDGDYELDQDVGPGPAAVHQEIVPKFDPFERTPSGDTLTVNSIVQLTVDVQASSVPEPVVNEPLA